MSNWKVPSRLLARTDVAPDDGLAPITLPDTGTGQGGSLSLVLAAPLCAVAGTGMFAGSRLVMERERE